MPYNVLSENKINSGKLSLETIISNGKILIYKTTIVTLTATILLYASIFMYASFYFAFIPVVAHEVLVFLLNFAQKGQKIQSLQFHRYFLLILQHARHHYILVSKHVSKRRKNVGTSMQAFHWICYLEVEIKVVKFHNLNQCLLIRIKKTDEIYFSN